MLSEEKLKVALADCSREVYWKPVHERAMLSIPLVDEGYVGGAFIPAAGARHKFQAIVLAANNCRSIEDGDLIWFDMGRGEELVTQAGETFFYITERDASAVNDEFWKAKEKEKQLASGLWVPVA